MNQEFIEILKKSFKTYLTFGARSNEKLKVLHPFIAEKILNRLGNDYSANSLGLLGDHSKESCVKGRYLDKKVDITIHKQDDDVAGLAVKFVMSNYSQNSNNYFENMLGETANIRTARIPYFQIFCIFDKLPYYDNSGNITKWETISKHNLDKYIKLSDDNIDMFFHTPNKTLLFLIHMDIDIPENINTKKQFSEYLLSNDFELSVAEVDYEFGRAVIVNDFGQFVDKVCHIIQGV